MADGVVAVQCLWSRTGTDPEDGCVIQLCHADTGVELVADLLREIHASSEMRFQWRVKPEYKKADRLTHQCRVLVKKWSPTRCQNSLPTMYVAYVSDLDIHPVIRLNSFDQKLPIRKKNVGNLVSKRSAADPRVRPVCLYSLFSSADRSRYGSKSAFSLCTVS